MYICVMHIIKNILYCQLLILHVWFYFLHTAKFDTLQWIFSLVHVKKPQLEYQKHRKGAAGHQIAIFGLHEITKTSVVLRVTQFNRNKEMLVKLRNDVYGSMIVQQKRSSFEYRTLCGLVHAYIALHIRYVQQIHV